VNSDVRIAMSTDARLLKRGCETLLGIANGLIADGELNETEIKFLSSWLSEHPELASTWPGEVVFKRVREALADGVIGQDERQYLLETLTELVGGSFVEDGAVPAGASTLPVDPLAVVRINSSSFCFTGKFLFGTRSACERAVIQRGGGLEGVKRSLDYLVIGELSSRDWKYSSHGTKIEAVMALKQAGHTVSIVSEAQWVAAL
jgi:hypothetical protein